MKESKMKVMLIASPATSAERYKNNRVIEHFFPIGLLSLATFLKQNNIETEVADLQIYCENNMVDYLCGLNEDSFVKYIDNHLLKRVGDYKPDVIGIGCLFTGAFSGLKIIAKRIKDVFPHIPIVIGGIHPTLFAEEILARYDFIDYIILGEGEKTFLNLLNCIKNKESLHSLDGIVFRHNGQIIKKVKTRFENSLDSLPFVDYNFLNLEDYKSDKSSWYSPKEIEIGIPFPIISGRSCPNQCSYCSMWHVHGKKIRFRSADNVLDEIEFLYKNFNASYFHFMDDNLTFDKKRTLDIFQGIIDRNLNIQFDTPNGTSANALDDEIIDVMVKAGLVRITIAIESGSQDIRFHSMNKYVTDDKIYSAAKACAKHNNLFINAFFMIGMPEETHKSLNETFKMIKELPLDAFSVFYVAPYPHTKLFDQCSKNNLISSDISKYINAENLQHANDKPIFKPYNLTEEDLIKFRNKCYNYLKEMRSSSNLPPNYPLRYKHEKIILEKRK